jgi:DNA-directed RNA polymerase, beta'' subunit/160 kD subunit
MTAGEIKKIKFDRLTDEQIEAFTDCAPIRQFSNTFLEESVYDRHMGVCGDRGKLCETCSSDWEKCVGGFGFIKLPMPYHFSNNRELLKALNALCFRCYRISCECLDKLSYKFVEKKSKDNYEIEFIEEGSKKVFNQKEIYDVLKRSDSIPLMNYNLIVTPVYTRPYMFKSGQQLHNDISTIYNAIIKDLLRKDVNHKEIYDKVEMLLTQKKNKLLPNSSKVPQSLQDKIQGKEGLINSNINGKRVNHSARANITGFPDGNLGEVGIPLCMAKKMTILENLGRIMETTDINTWIDIHKPLRIRKVCGKTFRFTPQTTSKIMQCLEKTDMIERPLRNGDIVLFNRQPSLRPESIIATRVRIIPSQKCNTFRLTLPCTPPLNADFDGDECNIHVLQDIRAVTECSELMNPAEQIISSQKGCPLFVPVQDALVGSYLITQKKTLLSKGETFDILFILEKDFQTFETKISLWNSINSTNQISYKDEFFPGQFVFSLLIDEHFYFQSEMIIENGIILVSSCALTKRILCGGLKSIIHKYYFSIGKCSTCILIDNIQQLTNYYLSRRGFTISLEDCRIKQSSYASDLKLMDEDGINTILGRIEVQLTRQKLIKEDNRLYTIVRSGAKGSMTSIVQITQLVGQQSIDGTKVKPEMTSLRTLVYYSPSKIKSIEETGFVGTSFFEGLSKSCNIFHAKAGRRGVTDSVTKVSESGYTSKKICKFLENLVIEYDLSVRNNETKRVVQFLFGTDGMNPQQLPAEDGKKRFLTTEDFISINFHQATCKEEAISYLLLSLGKISLGIRKPNLLLNELISKIAVEGMSTLSVLPYTEKNVDFSKSEAEIVTVLHHLLFRRLFQPGTSIGAICGTNFGEITSQLLLKSFHNAGIKEKDISGGIKRLNQLLNRTCSPSDNEIVCVARIKDDIYHTFSLSRKIVNDEFSRNILFFLMENRCHQLINKVKRRYFSTLVKLVLFKNCDCQKSNCNIFSKICESSFVYNITYEIDETKIDDCYLTINDIKNILIDNNIKGVKIYNNIISIPLKCEIGELWDVIEKFTHFNKTILNISICNGFIDNCEVGYDDTIGEFEVIFKGSKLTKILELHFVDPSTVYSLDPFEVTRVFGIEAGRRSLYNEICKVLSFDGADIDTRYIDLICDAMCCDGKIIAIINSPGVLTNALFEKEIKKLTLHSINKNVDPCTSVEACVFLGKICRMGTGFIDMLDLNGNIIP